MNPEAAPWTPPADDADGACATIKAEEVVMGAAAGIDGSSDCTVACAPCTAPSLKKTAITPSDFLVEVEIGVGAFGRVTKVRHLPSKRTFAMKAISKKVLRKKKISQREWRLERDVLVKIEPHPYVVELVCAFQTLSSFYLVMTYLPGGELFQFLRSRGTFAEDVAGFYAAEVTLALEHLHASGVIHRDLKPENLLMDNRGHVVVTDFGLAKMFESHEELHRTLCGTDEYMAPEMVARRSYGKAVDLWSLGVLIFEMVTGKPPFSAKDTKDLHRKILTEKVKFPSFLASSTVGVLRGLLERQVPKRLGATKSTMFQVGGFDALKTHAFFDHVEWQPLGRRESPPPLVASPAANPKKPALLDASPLVNKRLGTDKKDDDVVTNASRDCSTVLDFEYLRDGCFDPDDLDDDDLLLLLGEEDDDDDDELPLRRLSSDDDHHRGPANQVGGGASVEAAPPTKSNRFLVGEKNSPLSRFETNLRLDSPTSSQCDVSSSCTSSRPDSSSNGAAPKKPRPPRKRKKKKNGQEKKNDDDQGRKPMVGPSSSNGETMRTVSSGGRLESIPDSPHAPTAPPDRITTAVKGLPSLALEPPAAEASDQRRRLGPPPRR